jgi:uncharacterized membrane protein (UPF0127 family)
MGFLTTAPWDGMLFRFAGPTTASFYMKDTLIPLDIAFIGADERVAEVRAMSPCPPEVSACPLYGAKQPYANALEVEGGKAAAFGLTPGADVALGGAC